MKERMRKISLLVFYKEKLKVLNLLQDLGVVHLVTTETTNPTVEELSVEKNKYQKAIEILTDTVGEENFNDFPDSSDLKTKRDEIIDLQEKIEKASSKIEVYKKELVQLQPWGDFKWNTVKKLQENGLTIKFYVSPKKEYHNFDFKGIHNFIISESKSLIFFLIVEKEGKAEVPFEVVHLPSRSISELNELISQEETEIEQLKKEIQEHNTYYSAFRNEQVLLEDRLAYEIANSSFSSHAEGKILHIQGWFPARIESMVRQDLDKNNFSYVIEKPTLKDQIPIILKNKKYPKRFEPITKMFQLPNFYEFDLTPVVAVFYPIFFAYCLGDSGYGFVLLSLGILARQTFLKKTKIIAELIIILGIVAAIFGILKSGSFFGLVISDHQDIPIFNWLANFIVIPDDTSVIFNTFNVALMFGLLQIIVGVCISIISRIRYLSFIYSLSAFGKLFIIIGTVILFLGGMQDVAVFQPYMPIAWVLMIGGIVMVLLFHDPTISIFKRIGGGFLPVYFIFTGFLGDLLSYIRLFALGVASSILGIVVNDIGNQMMSGGEIQWIFIGIVFLILGHSLNLAIAALGSFVHPLRLTFVEFYNNAEFKGGGVEYKPFKKHVFQTNKI